MQLNQNRRQQRMNEMTHEQIEELWTTVSNYLPDRAKIDCAVDFVKTLFDQGVEVSELKAAGEYDDKLEQAIETVLDDVEEEDYEE